MADVFVSYARKDRQIAERIVHALTALNLSVWWDQRITPAESWDKLIETEIDAARAIFVLWTANSIESEWVRTEAEFAKKKNRLVQATVSCDAPLAFRMRQWADLSKWPEANQSEWERCLDWLSPLVGKSLTAKPKAPPQPPPAPQPALPEPGARIVQRRDLPQATPPTAPVAPRYRHILTLEHSRDLDIASIAFSEDEGFLAAATTSGDIDIWSLRDEKTIAQLRTQVFGGTGVTIALGANAQRVAISNALAEDSVSRSYDVATSTLLKETKIAPMVSASPAPSGRYILLKEFLTGLRSRYSCFDQLEARVVRRIQRGGLSGSKGAVSEQGGSFLVERRGSNRGADLLRPSLMGISARTIGAYAGADQKGYVIDLESSSYVSQPWALSATGMFLACWARNSSYSSEVIVFDTKGEARCMLGQWDQYRFLSDDLLLLRKSKAVRLHNVRKDNAMGDVNVENVHWATSIAGTRDGALIAVGCNKGHVQIFSRPS
jgi:hypothetical protein